MGKRLFPFVILMIFMLTGCGSKEPTANVQQTLPPAEPSVGNEAQFQSDIPDQTTPEEPTLSVPPSEPALPPLPDSQQVEFQSEDGTDLVGYYYPACHKSSSGYRSYALGWR